MKAFEIYFSDLNDDAKKRLLDAVKVKDISDTNFNANVYPVATYVFEEDCDPSRPGPLPSNTHVVSPYKCPNCGWYLIIDNDAYPPKRRFYCANCDYKRMEYDDHSKI